MELDCTLHNPQTYQAPTTSYQKKEMGNKKTKNTKVYSTANLTDTKYSNQKTIP